MKSIQALREEHNVYAKRVRELMENSQKEGATWTPENQAAYDADMAKIDAVTAEIKRTEQVLATLKDENLTAQIEKATHKLANKVRQLFTMWLRGCVIALPTQ